MSIGMNLMILDLHHYTNLHLFLMTIIYFEAVGIAIYETCSMIHMIQDQSQKVKFESQEFIDTLKKIIHRSVIISCTFCLASYFMGVAISFFTT